MCWIKRIQKENSLYACSPVIVAYLHNIKKKYISRFMVREMFFIRLINNNDRRYSTWVLYVIFTS